MQAMSSNPFQPPEHSGLASAQYVYRPLKTLTVLVGVALFLDVLFLALAGASQSMLLEHDPGVFRGRDPIDDTSIALGAAMGLSGMFYLLTYIGGGIVFLVWLVRASKNARALGSDGMEFTPGWTAGWFFVPFLNLFRPYEAVSELYQASDPDAGETEWAAFDPPGLILAWWISWIAFSVVGAVAQNFWRVPFLTAVLAAVSAVLAMRVLLAIERRQVEKKRRGGVPSRASTGAVPPSNRFL